MMRPSNFESRGDADRAPALRILVITALLGLAVGGGALLWNAQADVPAPPAVAPNAAAGTAEAAADTTSSHRVLAYYFHTTQRCASCRKIEANTAEAIQTGFAEELKDGRLVFQAVNIEERENAHFVEDYKLYTKSVILVDERSGKETAWKNLAKVWQLLNDKDAFVRYIQTETRTYLAGAAS